MEIPGASSLILKHDPKAPLAGLDTIPDDREPPVAIVFWSFRVMVGLGTLMLLLGLWSLFARLRGKLYDWPWLHRAAVAMGPAGFVAMLAGWITTEVGRQPWTVYGLLRTADSVSPLAAPIIAMLLALIFRDVAFEFRWRDPRHRAFWDLAFTAGSAVAALAQGIALGALLQGITVANRAYAGG